VFVPYKASPLTTPVKVSPLTPVYIIISRLEVPASSTKYPEVIFGAVVTFIVVCDAVIAAVKVVE
jgi:hypothetical protein